MATYGAGNKPSINDAITSMRSRLGGPRAVRRVKPRGTVGGPPLPMGDPTMAGRGGGGTAIRPADDMPFANQPGFQDAAMRANDVIRNFQGWGANEMPPALANKPLMSSPQPGGIGGAGMPAMPSTKPATPSQGGFGGGGVGVMPPSLDNKAGKGDVVNGKGGGALTAVNLDAMTLPDGRTVGRDANNRFPTSTAIQPMPLQSPTTNMTSYGDPETSMLPMDPGMGAEVDPNGGLTIGAGLGQGQPSGGIMDPGQQTPGIMGGGDAGMGAPPTAPQPFTGRGGNVQSMGQGRFGGAPPQDVLARRQALQQRQRALMGKG